MKTIADVTRLENTIQSAGTSWRQDDRFESQLNSIIQPRIAPAQREQPWDKSINSINPEWVGFEQSSYKSAATTIVEALQSNAIHPVRSGEKPAP